MQPYANLSVTSRPGYHAPHWQLLLYSLLALTLMVLDVRGHWLVQWRSQASVLIQPLWRIAGLPGRLENLLSEHWLSHNPII